MNEPFDIPVLLVIFNRADTTQQVLSAIRNVKPKKLYVAADGPRAHKEGEAKSCMEAREVVLNGVDWECEVITLFRTENVGCALGVSQAANWFFEQEEMGIILEDDCFPDETFFSFCAEMLHYYKEDERVMHISGFNIQNGKKRGNSSYYFSRYAEVWGWATWRRAWRLFDFEMSTYPDFLNDRGLDVIFKDPPVKKRWYKNFKYVLSEIPSTIWDYRWMYSIWKENGLCITPNISLVQNIGFDERAFHTKSPDNPFAKVKCGKISEIKHPSIMIPHSEADELTTAVRHQPPLFTRAKLKLRYLAKKTFSASKTFHVPEKASATE